MTAILILGGLAALTIGCVFAFRGSLLAGGVAFVIAGRIAGKYVFALELGSFQLTLDLLILAALIAAWLVQRGLGRTERRPLLLADWAFIAFLALLTVNTFTHDWRPNREGQMPGPDRNTLQASPVYRLAAGFLMPGAIYLLVRQGRYTGKQVRGVLVACTVLGVYLAVTGILEVLRAWPLVFPKFIADPALGLHFGRARGPMLHSVSYGIFLSLGLFAAWLWLYQKDRARWWLTVLVPLMLAGVFVSFTRSIWMGVGAGLLLILALTLQPRTRLAVVGGTICLLALLVVSKFDSVLGFDRGETAAQTRNSAEMRGVFTYVSWLMFQDHPLWGVGLGRFPEAKLAYLSDRQTELYLEGIRNWTHHNGYLSLLTETGLFGLALFVFALCGWCRNAWRLATRPDVPQHARLLGLLTLGMLCVYCVQLAFHELCFMPHDQALMFLLGSLTCNGVSRHLVSESTERAAQAAAPVRPVLAGA